MKRVHLRRMAPVMLCDPIWQVMMLHGFATGSLLTILN